MKTRSLRTISMAAAAALMLTSSFAFAQDSRKTTVRGNKTYTTQTFNVDQFEGLDCSGMFNIEYIQSDSDQAKVEVTTSSNIQEYILARVRDGVLKLGLSESHRYDVKRIDVKVYSNTLESAIVRGAANLSMKEGLDSRNLSITVNGAGELNMKDIEVDKSIVIDINGAGDVNISDIEADDISVDVSGAGDVEMSGIESNTLSVAIKGAGSAGLSGKTGTAKLRVSGVGSINAERLEAKNYDASKSGVGKISY